MNRGLRSRSASRRRGVSLLIGAVLAASGLSAFGEHGALAEGGDGGAKVPAAPPRTADPHAKIPPDPPPLSERMQWVFDLRWQKGEVYLLQIHKVDMGTAIHPTPRVMGRFALELYEGPTLIERARFDFPLLGGAPETADASYRTPPRIEPGLTTRIGVFFPATKRGTRLELWDRATDRRWPLPWPPREGVAGDGTVRDAATE